jgi:2-methylfumaryl-CoA hydratase
MSLKTNPGNYFEDFVTGATLVHAVPRTITEGDQALYVGLTGDRYPLHCSAEFARTLGYQRETVNDLLVFHMVFGKTVNDVSLNAVANLGYASVKFHLPVYPGDTVRTVSEVIGKKENSSGKNGVVWVRSTGTNQRGEVVLSFYRWVMVNKRDGNTPTGANDEPVMPKLPKAVSASWWSRSSLRPRPLPRVGASGSAFLDDYQVGERIDHVDGMTIEEAEHAIATRLYQNTAKVHFDSHQAKNTRFGKRLMYGGHVISVARALSYNGLENALGILAMERRRARQPHVRRRHALRLQRGAGQAAAARPHGLRRAARAPGGREERGPGHRRGAAQGGGQVPPERGARPRLLAAHAHRQVS